MMKEEFYVGYMPNAPKGISKFAKLIIALLFVLLAVVAYVISTSQRFISNGVYEFGELTELEGLLYESPQPFLKVSAGFDLNGNEVFKNILLINYGKIGAQESVEKIKRKIGTSFDRVAVKIRGTLIYHNGVTLLELTEKENSFQSAELISEFSEYKRHAENHGEKTLTGEIIDPKCYFGSMKPGQGKPHKSCAGLCISGGIPPMFVVQNENDQADYYLIMGENGEQLSDEVIPFVSDPSTLSGRVETLDEWNVIYIDPSKIKRLD